VLLRFFFFSMGHTVVPTPSSLSLDSLRRDFFGGDVESNNITVLLNALECSEKRTCHQSFIISSSSITSFFFTHYSHTSLFFFRQPLCPFLSLFLQLRNHHYPNNILYRNNDQAKRRPSPPLRQRRHPRLQTWPTQPIQPHLPHQNQGPRLQRRRSILPREACGLHYQGIQRRWKERF